MSMRLVIEILFESICEIDGLGNIIHKNFSMKSDTFYSVTFHGEDLKTLHILFLHAFSTLSSIFEEIIVV